MVSKTLSKFAAEYVRDLTSLGGLPVYVLLALFFLLRAELPVFYRLVLMFVAILSVTYAIKAVYFKPRPDNVKKVKAANLLEKADLSSFPSVHAARATALAVFFSFTYASAAMSLVAAASVLAVCVSRIILDRHYAIDVLAGVALGATAGYLALNV